MCASLFECCPDVGPGGVCGASTAGRHGPGDWANDPRSAELPRLHHAGDSWRTAAAIRRQGVPAAGWQLAGHAEHARPAGAGLHGAAAGDEYLSVPGPIPILLGGPLVLWARSSMGRGSLPAVRFSWPSTISITMAGSTTAVVTVAATGAATAAVTAAGGERHRLPQFTAHGACSMMARDARTYAWGNRLR